MRFDTDIYHIPGISNSAADALSRYPYAQDLEKSSAHEPITPFVNATSIVEFDKDVLTSIAKHYEDDGFFGPVIRNPE